MFVDTEGSAGIHPSGLLLAGFAAGGVAAWATNPLETICTRLMTQASGGIVRYSGILDAFAQIHAAGGVTALFSGSLPRMIYCMPFSALHLAIYESCRQMLAPPSSERK
uniref:ADP,ATP carrier protein n=1 Tax=Pinguiococcus pyrenoidosus TaxID=172671 RepID=A0A7R9YCX4_9STRA